MFAHGSFLLHTLTLTLPLTTTAYAHPPQQVLGNNNNNNKHHAPPVPGFVALGDSYSAGIGTPIPGPKENNCRQGTGAYPFLLARDLLPNTTTHNNNNTTSPFQWLSCTGSLTTDVLSSPSPSTSPSQIDSFTTHPHPPTFATLSIGGNDLGFFDVLNACIFRFYSFYSGTCTAALAAADAAIRSPDFDLRLVLVLREILDKVQWEKHPDFTITVTGYARFFSEETVACDEVSLGVWWGGAGVVRGPKLTRELRRRINELVVAANEKIRRTVEGVNGAFKGMERVVFVDFDDEFEGHRFCEGGVEEPDYGREETWFFLPGGGDSGEGKGAPDPPPKDGEWEGEGWLEEGSELVDADSCLERAERGGDWGERALCYMAVVKDRFPEEKLMWEDKEERLKGEEVSIMWRAPTYYGKTFHPRSKAHEAIRDKIYDVWQQHGINLGPRV
ncbi:SGNH hydrolase-type esterase domain-containing protein [Immersiella caudata]|uniref:SGNH hydrolase-type esterase domain-containing protein n=1 Tax=Immersiella caudata TaxID=314043 RepID=A0AA39WWP1_9PEZI|nr:SGNH hydrolase-type esterase domain-containing protein [Immersiella caudata]